MLDVESINDIIATTGEKKFLENDRYKQVTRWETKYTKSRASVEGNFSTYELQELLINDICKSLKLSDANEEFVVLNSAYSCYHQELLKRLNLKLALQVRKLHALKRLKREAMLAAVLSIKKTSCDRPTYHLPKRETLVVAPAEMKAGASTQQNKKKISSASSGCN